jgi:hypothetical protein
MDKSIIEKLAKYGFITNIDVDANKYKDIDDLIAKGIITVPGAKTRILEIVGDFITELEETIETTKATVLDNVVNDSEDNDSEDNDSVATKPETNEEITVTVNDEPAEIVVNEDPAKAEIVIEEEIVEATVEENKSSKNKKQN